MKRRANRDENETRLFLSRFALGLFSVCSWFVLGLFSVCSRFALGLLSTSRAQVFKGGGGGRIFFKITYMDINMDCDHPTLLALISGDSPKIKITTLSRGAKYRKIFRQITYLDEVIEDYLWCTICKKLLAYRTSNLIRHWRTHELSKTKAKDETSRKT